MTNFRRNSHPSASAKRNFVFNLQAVFGCIDSFLFFVFHIGSGSQYSNILMLLRKAANHPLLLRNFYKDGTLLEMAKKYCKVNAFEIIGPKGDNSSREYRKQPFRIL